MTQLAAAPAGTAARGGGNVQADPDRDHVYRRIRHFVSAAAARLSLPSRWPWPWSPTRDLDLAQVPFAG